MASGKSIYLQTKLLDLTFGASLWTPPTTIYLALSTAFFSASGPTEPVGNAYARASSTNNSTEWPGASGSPLAKQNANSVLFPSPTGSWGTIKSAYAMDAASGGNWLYGGDLLAQILVVTGQAPVFGPGTVTFQES